MACPRLRLREDERGPSMGNQGGVTITAERVGAFPGEEFVGSAIVVFHEKSRQARVMRVDVDPEFRRCGVATKLYERMAQIACSEELKLASDTDRSKATETFWRKQVRKGRARCVDRKRRGNLYEQGHGTTERHWSCFRYALKQSCPRHSLRGPRTR